MSPSFKQIHSLSYLVPLLVTLFISLYLPKFSWLCHAVLWHLLAAEPPLKGFGPAVGSSSMPRHHPTAPSIGLCDPG